ncbi:hypothetical protein [Actinomadura rupiterrae]|uniref:hypothetical protein n=1 Tax=Actinomadura rupiterrae TaxID=559627 RepID=UPI0020A46EB2|nr:hypothetical protein [Actinomadura rupiterrae]MCP2343383.1 hypothetical protein [Actinomadura rupiterrae]
MSHHPHVMGMVGTGKSSTFDAIAIHALLTGDDATNHAGYLPPGHKPDDAPPPEHGSDLD